MDCRLVANDKVVCIYDYTGAEIGREEFAPENNPIKGTIYTIRELIKDEGEISVRLKEIVNEPKHYKIGFIELAFHHYHFRKLDISQFKDMCKQSERIDA